MVKWIVAGLAALLIAAGAAWYFAAPAWTLSAMKQAADAGDGDRLAAHIDFPALRASLKDELKAKATAEIGGNGANGPLGSMGAALAMAIADPAVDALVTPQGVGQLLKSGSAGGVASSARVDLSSPHRRIVRDGFDQFRVVETDRPEHGAQLVFHRRGIDWKLAGVRLAKGGSADR